MPEDNQPPVEGTGDSSGKGGEGDDDRQPSYESYQKVLGEKKKVQERNSALEKDLQETRERLKAIESAQKDAEHKSLEEQNQFKELYSKTKEELDATNSRLSSIQKDQIDARKMHSFLGAVKAEIPKQYWGLVDLDKIAVEGDQIDEYSVQKYVETFKESYPDIVRPRDNRKMPTDSPPADDQTSLSMESWQKLSGKEKQEKLHLVMRNKQ